MKKKCFLHIGTPKTGTTSLQQFLHKNRESLCQLGYLYPFNVPSQANLAWILTNHPAKNDFKNNWNDLEDEINTKNLDNIIISSEFFISFTENEKLMIKISEKLGNYDTKIIIYLKRQDLYIESNLGQVLKTGYYAGEVSEYLDKYTKNRRKYYLNYLDILEKWSQYFGRENLIVVPLETQQVPDIYNNFLSIIGLNSDEIFNKPTNTNLKPNLAQITALYLINQQLAQHIKHDYERQRIFVKKYLNSFLQTTQHWQSKTKYNLISYDCAISLLTACLNDNSEIARKYLNRKEGQLFYEPLQKYNCDTLELRNLNEMQVIDLVSFLVERKVLDDQTNLDRKTLK